MCVLQRYPSYRGVRRETSLKRESAVNLVRSFENAVAPLHALYAFILLFHVVQ